MENNIFITHIKLRFSDTKNRLVVTRGGGREWVKWVKVVKMYKLPIKRQIRPGDVIYSMATTVSNTSIIYSRIANRVILKSSPHKKKCVTM